MLRITVLKNVYPPVLGQISRDLRLLSWKSPGLQVTQVGRSGWVSDPLQTLDCLLYTVYSKYNILR